VPDEHGDTSLEGRPWCRRRTPFEAEVLESCAVPPVRGRIVLRWFTDHDRTTRTDQSGGEPEGVVRWTEATRDDAVGDLIREVGRIGGDHAHPVLPAEAADRPFQEIGPLRATIEQRDLEVRSIVGDDQSRDPTSRTEVEHTSDRGGDLQRADEAAGVLDHLGNRPSTEEAEPLGVGQDTDQRIIGCLGHRSGGFDDDPAIRILADGTARHVGFLVEHVVDDLAVGRAHRLE
jgi:hypothetical protein